MPADPKPGPFAIGSTLWPGLSKLAEEAGEVVQVIGKLMGTGGAVMHWDGSNLAARLEDEVADLSAAMTFVIRHCRLDVEAIDQRAVAKLQLFDEWHKEGDPLEAPDA
jgi:NTP pyrophosphatase (non-canonical NTP hydrolase)